MSKKEIVLPDDDYWPCPVKACRREGTVEMYHLGIAMFRACQKHADAIWESNWHGWVVDYNAKKERLTIFFDEARV
jgi:hypothetical protein